jgi:hypothetical protein
VLLPSKQTIEAWAVSAIPARVPQTFTILVHRADRLRYELQHPPSSRLRQDWTTSHDHSTATAWSVCVFPNLQHASTSSRPLMCKTFVFPDHLVLRPVELVNVRLLPRLHPRSLSLPKSVNVYVPVTCLIRESCSSGPQTA